MIRTKRKVGRFYEEYEYERRLKKRRAKLITATEEAFAHIKRMPGDHMKGKSNFSPQIKKLDLGMSDPCGTFTIGP